MAAPLPPSQAPLELVWADEFDAAKVDTAKWNVADDSRPNYDGGVNTYDPQDVYTQGGDLVLRSRSTGAGTDGSPAYTSGRVSTENKFSFLYGRVDIRATLPGTKGLWPAAWMLPQDGPWPPEIDILELLGDRPDRVYLTSHWGSRRNPSQSQSHFEGRLHGRVSRLLPGLGARPNPLAGRRR